MLLSAEMNANNLKPRHSAEMSAFVNVDCTPPLPSPPLPSPALRPILQNYPIRVKGLQCTYMILKMYILGIYWVFFIVLLLVY